jgi:hypothetical protein
VTVVEPMVTGTRTPLQHSYGGAAVKNAVSGHFQHSLTVHSTLSYMTAIVRYNTRAMEILGNFTMENLVRYSTLSYRIAIVRVLLAYYSANSRYCETTDFQAINTGGTVCKHLPCATLQKVTMN